MYGDGLMETEGTSWRGRLRKTWPDCVRQYDTLWPVRTLRIWMIAERESRGQWATG